MSEAEIVGGFVDTTNFFVNILVKVVGFLSNILTNIGGKEVFIILLIGLCIYFWANQHSYNPIKVNPKF